MKLSGIVLLNGSLSSYCFALNRNTKRMRINNGRKRDGHVNVNVNVSVSGWRKGV